MKKKKIHSNGGRPGGRKGSKIASKKIIKQQLKGIYK